MEEGHYFRKEIYFRQNLCQSDYTGDLGRYLFDRGNRYDLQKPDPVDAYYFGRPLGDAIFCDDVERDKTTKSSILRETMWGIISEKNKISGQRFGNFGYGYRIFNGYTNEEIRKCIPQETGTINIKIN